MGYVLISSTPACMEEQADRGITVTAVFGLIICSMYCAWSTGLLYLQTVVAVLELRFRAIKGHEELQPFIKVSEPIRPLGPGYLGLSF